MTAARPAPPLGVLFDLDGTLLDFEGCAHLALNRALGPAVRAKLGDEEPVTWELHAQIVGQKGTLWSRTLLQRLDVDPQLLAPQQYLDAWHHHLEEFYPSMSLMPGALSLVSSLKRQGLRIAIATSSERAGMLHKTSYHPDLMALVDAVVTGDEVVNSKPAPDIFLKAAARLGLDPSRCLVFEDAPSGVLAGKAAGCRVFAVPDDRFARYNGPERFAHADVVLKSLSEFSLSM
jgi:HAD superfamily hydrolase (TIGR01509 family)